MRSFGIVVVVGGMRCSFSSLFQWHEDYRALKLWQEGICRVWYDLSCYFDSYHDNIPIVCSDCVMTAETSAG